MKYEIIKIETVDEGYAEIRLIVECPNINEIENIEEQMDKVMRRLFELDKEYYMVGITKFIDFETCEVRDDKGNIIEKIPNEKCSEYKQLRDKYNELSEKLSEEDTKCMDTVAEYIYNKFVKEEKEHSGSP